ncbi:MAG: mechanosensitive ion channel [Clostridium sp.]|nr:mechanosensitive ion channel [Clostridium sp.]
MNLLNYVSKITGINNNYFTSSIESILVLFILRLSDKVFQFINNKFNKNDKNKYKLNKRIHLINNIIIIIAFVIIWQDYFKNFLTLISFVSAALTFALRDIILNFFSGIYIKINKPFSVEDRIEINDNIGDVININYLNFEILEVKEEEKGEQSTGIIIQIPSSKIFNYPIKNYSKAFKYIWKEMEINVPIDSDIEKDKKTLYKIINSNETLKKIPNKMKNQLNNVVGEYRIYYNNLDPIIYTSVVDNHVKLTIRFLCHPKKVRNIESDLWNKILLANKEGKIKLFID